MRAAFVEALEELAASDPRVFLLTADLGWSILERFAERFPRRFVNVGVAEQNMLGIATGLAREGFVPFVYSIATFATMRCYEQLRDGPILHRLPVRVVGIGGGYAYGAAGPTHHALEDLCIGRTQPGLVVIAPADPGQARAVVRATARIPGPIYLRVDKGEVPAIPALHREFDLDAPILVRPGRGVLLLATGSIVHDALQAAELLRPQGIDAAVAVQAHLSFTGGSALRDLLRQYTTVTTIEEGYIAGGLGSLVAETLATNGLTARLLTLGVRQSFPPTVGGTRFLRRRQGLSPDGIAHSVLATVARRAAA